MSVLRSEIHNPYIRVMDFFMDRERSTMENYIFEKMPVPKAYMKLAIPVVMSMIVSLVYNMVDTYFIALTG